jgi:hypothetical protein
VAHLDHLMFCGPISPQTPPNPSIKATEEPLSHQNAAATSSCSEREEFCSRSRHLVCSGSRATRSPASCAIVIDCRVSPSSASSPPPSSASSRRDRLLCYLLPPPPPLLLRCLDAFLLAPPRLSPGDEQRRADPLALLPNPRRRDAPLVQPALALDALKTMVVNSFFSMRQQKGY